MTLQQSLTEPFITSSPTHAGYYLVWVYQDKWRSTGPLNSYDAERVLHAEQQKYWQSQQ